jgi:hypothetical protein
MSTMNTTHKLYIGQPLEHRVEYVSSMTRLCEKLGVSISNTPGTKAVIDDKDDWRRTARPWTCTLRMGRHRLTVPFWQGPAHTKEPTAADVLSCLVADADALDYSFEEWCGDFGYDTDSRTAEKTYKACCKSGMKTRRFLGEHYEEFRKAEH